jgi:hypothetical protein
MAAEHDDRPLRLIEHLWSALLWLAISVVGLGLAFVAPRHSNVELAGKLIVIGAAFLFLLRFVSQSRRSAVSRPFKETP